MTLVGLQKEARDDGKGARLVGLRTQKGAQAFHLQREARRSQKLVLFASIATVSF